MTAAMSALNNLMLTVISASRCEDYIDRYEDYCLAFDVTDSKWKRALLLHSAGVDVRKIHKTL